MAKITKDILQLFCKSIGLPATGNKADLQKRICSELCIEKDKSLREMIRKKNDKVKTIAKDIDIMIQDDSSDAMIAKSLSKHYNIKIEKIDVYVFAELLDAHRKKDYDFIDQTLEELGNKAKYGHLLFKMYI